MDPWKRLRVSVACIVAVGLFGTAGYWLLGWPLLDAVYMTVITVTTVGYREVGPMDTRAIVFTMVLLTVGFGTVFYSFSALIELVIAGQLGKVLGRQRVQKRIDALVGHYVVCGGGRMGRIVCRELERDGHAVVLVERSEPVLEGLPYLYVRGDATDEDVLRSAGLERARGLVATLSTDADNLFVILSARAINAKLEIVARAADERSEQKLLRAGAGRVVSPYLIGGVRIAQALLRPSVLDFIEVATRRGRLDLLMEETQVGPQSPLVGKPIKYSRVRSELGLIIVAIKRASGDMVFNPPPDHVIAAGEILLTLGERRALDQLEELASPPPR